MAIKKPFVTKEKVKEIAQAFPTPFHLYDEAGIRQTVDQVNSAFKWWNTGYREYYAVKACPNDKILKLLKELGCGCDCSSMTELYLAHACGFRGDQIMFSSNDTPDDEYITAAKLGAIINLDDITHIDQLKKLLDHFPSTMSCRYNPGGVFEMSNGIMDNPGEAKYGMTEEQIFDAFAQLQELGVRHFGLHAFLASNTLGDDYYAENARILFELAVKLHEKLHCHIDFINLSGGVGIPYRPEQEPNDIANIGRKVQKRYVEIFKPHKMEGIKIYTEMGRFITGPHGCLVTKVIHEKHTHKHYLGVDACAADLMRPAMYGAYHHITVLGKEDQPCDHTYDVTGSLCENNDKFAVDRQLPEIEIGDYLVIHDTGAHGRAMGYNYNGKLRSGEVLLCQDGGFQIIRRKETPADLFATLSPHLAETMASNPEIYPHYHG